jgi:hypothetical protein
MADRGWVCMHQIILEMHLSIVEIKQTNLGNGTSGSGNYKAGLWNLGNQPWKCIK